MISEQDVQAYKRDGVIMVPEVLDASTLSRVRIHAKCESAVGATVKRSATVCATVCTTKAHR